MAATTASNKMIDALNEITLEKLVSAQKLITIKHNSTIEQVVKILAENRIHAAPVLEDDTCIGFVDMLDVVSHVIKVAPEPDKIEAEELKSLQMAGRAMAFEQVQHVLNASGRDPYIPFQATSLASGAVDYFARGLHRILLLQENKPTRTVSQSDLVNYLAQLFFDGKLKKIGYLDEKINNLGFGTVVPTTVLQTESVIIAISILNEKKLGAIPVVDAEGKLVGNFSATDLRGLYTEEWPHFKWSVADYLNKYSPKSIGGNVLKLSFENTFSDLLKIFKEKRVHQLYITDNDGKPTGVVSLTDVMKFVRDTK